MIKNNVFILLFSLFLFFYLLNYINNVVDDVIKQTNVLQQEQLMSIKNINLELIQLKNNTEKNAENISFLDFSMKSSEKMKAKIEKVKFLIREDIEKQRYQTNLSSLDIYNLSSALVRFSERYSVPTALVLAVLKQESGFNSKVTSKAGAQGLMQIMPQTSKECALELNKKEYEYEIFNISDNVQFGTFYLSKMLDMFKKDISLSIKAYNAGPVYIKKCQSQEDGFINLPEETIKYHENVMKYYINYQERGL